MSKDKKEDISTPVLAKPRSFLELLGYYENADGTLTLKEEKDDGDDTGKES